MFAGILAGSLIVLALLGALLLRFIRRLSRLAAVRQSSVLRHGLANLYRPGAHTLAILASLGIGVMFTVTVYFLQYSLLEEVRLTAPPDTPNLFLINITDVERDGLTRLDRKRSRHRRSPATVPISRRPNRDDRRSAFGTDPSRTRRATVSQHSIRADLVSGHASGDADSGRLRWPPQPETPLVSVQEFAAQALGLKIGSVIEWTALGGNVKARVANIRKTDAIRVGANNQFILSPGRSR